MIDTQGERGPHESAKNFLTAVVALVKANRRIAVHMTYLVASVGFLVAGIVGGIAFLFSSNPYLRIDKIVTDFDRVAIILVPVIFGILGFIVCRLLFGKIWVQPASLKKI